MRTLNTKLVVTIMYIFILLIIGFTYFDFMNDEEITFKLILDNALSIGLYIGVYIVFLLIEYLIKRLLKKTSIKQIEIYSFSITLIIYVIIGGFIIKFLK